MFTGIIEQTGTVKWLKSTAGKGILAISLEGCPPDIKTGESIAINGACLTLSNYHSNMLSFDIMIETLAKTNLGHLNPGEIVNIERSLKVTDRLGGHIVSGHIDGTGRIKKIKKEKEFVLSISASSDIITYLIPKGSIAIDGISLTIVDLKKDWFSVHIIPHTLKTTNLRFSKEGDILNLEADIIGKFVHRYLTGKQQKPASLTKELLAEYGF